MILHRLAGGFSATQILVTAAKLHIADRLGDTPRSAADLAGEFGADPRALYRFLRMLVALNLLTQSRNGRFGLSSLGQFLRSDHPQSVHERLIYIAEISYQVAAAMTFSVQTGKPAFKHVFGEQFFDYFGHNPKLSAIFSRLMSQSVADRSAGVTRAYDFSRMKTIVDIGGGNGALLSAILTANPDAKGIIFDTPDVIAQARASLASSGVASRIDLVGGDMFRGPLPASGDLYVLSNIVHDWDDQAAKQILRNCRAAIRTDSRLLLIEEVMPARVGDSPKTIANDYSMLLLTGGRQRTKLEFRELLAAADFQLNSAIQFGLAATAAGRRENWAILECKPRRPRGRSSS
jgi:O-methyltransferase domain/Dimerisation domain